MTCGEGRVCVLTGKLPRAPKTRNGEPQMTAGEVRYFSLMHLLMFRGSMFDPQDVLTLYGGLMDDELITPTDGPNQDWFVIVYSRKPLG